MTQCPINNLPICLEQPFLTACEKNDFKRAEACLNLDADPNVKTKDGHWSGLIYAAEKNYQRIFDLLLSHPKINVNISDRDDWTPLMWSCCNGQSEITQKLVSAPGVDLNCQSLLGSTAAILAALNNQTECLKILATQDSVKWNIQSKDSWTAAMWAVNNKHVENVRILLTIPTINWNLRKNGKASKPNSSAVTIAFEGGNKEIINLVLSAGGLELDIDYMKSLNVFDKAVTACKEFVSGKMGDEGIYDEETITSFALEHDMVEITKVLVEDAFDKGRTNGHKSAPPLKKEAPPAPASAPPSEESYREECPVCLEVFTSRMRIHQCTQGHFTCELCRNQMESCSECREPFIGRAHGYERILRRHI